MTDWTTITDSQVDPKAPVTSELMTALRDNPIATAEKATGAPYVENNWYPYNSTSVGNNDGLVYDFAVDGQVSSVQMPALEAGYDYRVECVALTPSIYLSSPAVGIQVYRETSANWAQITTSFNYITSSFCYMMFDLPGPYTVSRNVHVGTRHYGITTTHSDAVSSFAVNSPYLVENTAQKLSLIRVIGITRPINGGKIYFYRRKASTI